MHCARFVSTVMWPVGHSRYAVLSSFVISGHAVRLIKQTMQTSRDSSVPLELPTELSAIVQWPVTCAHPVIVLSSGKRTPGNKSFIISSICSAFGKM